MFASDSQQERLAHNQSLYREINEQIASLNKLQLLPTFTIVCECADTNCAERFDVAMAEYEAVRSEPDQFLVVPGHTVPEIERAVRSGERYAVIEKQGTAGQVAVELSPRHN